MSAFQSSCHLQDSQRVQKILCRGMDCKKCNEFRVNYDQAVISYHLQDMAKKEPVGLDKTAPETYLKLKREIERLKAENEKLKQKQLRVINYSKDKLDQMWAATIVSVLLDCDFRDAKEAVKKWEGVKDE